MNKKGREELGYSKGGDFKIRRYFKEGNQKQLARGDYKSKRELLSLPIIPNKTNSGKLLPKNNDYVEGYYNNRLTHNIPNFLNGISIHF